MDWKLTWRDRQPIWTSPGSRVVQLGDAAHTFLPTSGNGGTQAIEDAVSLATCLTEAGCKRIPEATKVHNLLRFERVSCLQAFGVVNRQKVTTHAGGKAKDTKSMQAHIGRWMLEHDPERYARDNHHQALACLQHGVPFQNNNTPPDLVHKPWTIEGLLEAADRGEQTILDGKWDQSDVGRTVCSLRLYTSTDS